MKDGGRNSICLIDAFHMLMTEERVGVPMRLTGIRRTEKVDEVVTPVEKAVKD